MTLLNPRTSTRIAPAAPASGALRPLGLDEVAITGGFWAARAETNRTATLPHILGWLERAGWLPNFDLAAAGALPGGRRGREFSDSEVYKFLEAAAWSLGAVPDARLEATFTAVVARVAAAQEPDGYLNTNFGRAGQRPRWSDLEWGHELYCLGHLFQAAVARARTRPAETDGLLAIAVRAADLVCAVFGDGGDERVCGHPEVETGLVELGRLTGEPRYVEQAARFIDRRGHGVLRPNEWGAAYFQDDEPVRTTTALHGHAVRANYLAAGAVDVATERGDAALLDALIGQWRNTVARRTYITGGQGAHHQDEAFGLDWELPPDRAYSETCAGIGSIQFSWRLLLATGEPQYADLIERTLFNVVATSPSEAGTAFFYSNTLHQREEGAPADPDVPSARANASLRAPWFEVSCCPPNVARTLASLPAYLATVSPDGLQVHQYAAATVRTTLPDGEPVEVQIDADYPRSGAIRVLMGRDAARAWTLSLRVPSWAIGARLRVLTREEVVSDLPVGPGVATATRRFQDGDVVELTLPVEPRTTRPDPRIDAIRGCVAVERGPEVLCLESVDLSAELAGRSVDDVRLRSTAVGDDLSIAIRMHDAAAAVWPYGSEAPGSGTDGTARLIPYRSWADRGPSTMRIWLPLPGTE